MEILAFQKLKCAAARQKVKKYNWLRNQQPSNGGRRFLTEQGKETEKNVAFCVTQSASGNSSPRCLKLVVALLGQSQCSHL